MCTVQRYNIKRLPSFYFVNIRIFFVVVLSSSLSPFLVYWYFHLLIRLCRPSDFVPITEFSFSQCIFDRVLHGTTTQATPTEISQSAPHVDEIESISTIASKTAYHFSLIHFLTIDSKWQRANVCDTVVLKLNVCSVHALKEWGKKTFIQK